MAQEGQCRPAILLYPNCQAVQKVRESQPDRCLLLIQVGLSRQVIQGFLEILKVRAVPEDPYHLLVHLVQLDHWVRCFPADQVAQKTRDFRSALQNQPVPKDQGVQKNQLFPEVLEVQAIQKVQTDLGFLMILPVQEIRLVRDYQQDLLDLRVLEIQVGQVDPVCQRFLPVQEALTDPRVLLGQEDQEGQTNQFHPVDPEAQVAQRIQTVRENPDFQNRL